MFKYQTRHNELYSTFIFMSQQSIIQWSVVGFTVRTCNISLHHFLPSMGYSSHTLHMCTHLHTHTHTHVHHLMYAHPHTSSVSSLTAHTRWDPPAIFSSCFATDHSCFSLQLKALISGALNCLFRSLSNSHKQRINYSCLLMAMVASYL